MLLANFTPLQETPVQIKFLIPLISLHYLSIFPRFDSPCLETLPGQTVMPIDIPNPLE